MDFKHYEPDFDPDQYKTWSRMALHTEQADPFCCTPEWQLSFHEAFGPDRRLLIKESGNSVLAFAEHIESNDEVILTPIETHWFFGSPLLGENSVELFADTLSDIQSNFATIPKIILSGIRPESRLPIQLLSTLGSHFEFYRLSSSLQSAASLSGGIDGFLSRRSSNHRKKLRKQMRRAVEAGIYYERVAPATPEEAAKTYARMLQVEQASWKGIEECGMAESPAKEFYDSMMQRLARINSSRIIFAKHEEKDIGFIFGAMAGSTYRGQQFSYDEDWKQYSIGNLMQVEQVKWLCEEGAYRYDMGPITGPKMGYKKHWTEVWIGIEAWMLVPM